METTNSDSLTVRRFRVRASGGTPSGINPLGHLQVNPQALRTCIRHTRLASYGEPEAVHGFHIQIQLS